MGVSIVFNGLEINLFYWKDVFESKEGQSLEGLIGEREKGFICEAGD